MSEQDFAVTQEERREEALRFNEHLSNLYGPSNFESDQEILKVGSIKMGEMYDNSNPNNANVDPNEEPIIVDGVYFNSRGFEICGQLNQHSKPCQRIGKCPFHKKTESLKSSRDTPIKKESQAPYKQGWTKDEHLLFLNGLHVHGKGAWKEISMIVRTRTPTQIQSHAQKYYLRQKQDVKHKRSIHDVSLEEVHENKDPLGANHYPNYSPLIAVPPQHAQYHHQDIQQYIVFPPAFPLPSLPPSLPWFPHCVNKPNYNDFGINLSSINNIDTEVIEESRDPEDEDLKDGKDFNKRYDNLSFNYAHFPHDENM